MVMQNTQDKYLLLGCEIMDKLMLNTPAINYVTSLLPSSVSDVASNYLRTYPNISEIRMHLNSPLSFTLHNSNIVSKIICTRKDLDECISKMTNNNYAFYEEMMKNGVITLDFGCRAGVCGEAVNISNKVFSLRNINYINIRISHNTEFYYENIFDYIQTNNFQTSILIISPPGVGKTSALKSITAKLSTPPVSKRVCVVDTNRELTPHELPRESLANYLSGYPKSVGISIAVAYLNPQYILCDELGGIAETEAICEFQHSGVPFIATAHASNIEEIYKKRNLKHLMDSGVFDTVIRLYRENDKVNTEIIKVK